MNEELGTNTSGAISVAPNPASFKLKKSRFIMPEWLKALIALAPALFFLVVFMIYPILNAFFISLIEDFTWQSGGGSSFAFANWIAAFQNSRLTKYPLISLQNYISVLTEPTFLNSLLNTVLIVVVSVPLTIVISLLLAVCINSIKGLKAFFQTVFFLPYVTNSIALGMVFNIMFSSGGPINHIFTFMMGKNWLMASNGATRWTMFAVLTIYSVWNGLAFKILVFMGGLASIDKQYYDAAKIDGAGKAKILWKITVPLLSPQILYITITSFIGAFKAYSQVIALFGEGRTGFGGNDNKEWMTVVGFVYNEMSQNHTGKAAAASILLLLVILSVTAVQNVVSKNRVHY